MLNLSQTHIEFLDIKCRNPIDMYKCEISMVNIKKLKTIIILYLFFGLFAKSLSNDTSSNDTNIQWYKIPLATIFTLAEAGGISYNSDKKLLEALKEITEQNKEELAISVGVSAGLIVSANISFGSTGSLLDYVEKTTGNKPKTILLLSADNEAVRKDYDAIQKRYPESYIYWTKKHSPDGLLEELTDFDNKMNLNTMKRFDSIVIVGHGESGKTVATEERGKLGKSLNKKFLAGVKKLNLTNAGASIQILSCGSSGNYPLERSGGLYMSDIGDAFLKNGGSVHGTKMASQSGEIPSLTKRLKNSAIYSTRSLTTHLKQIAKGKINSKTTEFVALGLFRLAFPIYVAMRDLDGLWASNPTSIYKSIKTNKQGEQPIYRTNCLIRTIRNLIGI